MRAAAAAAAIAFLLASLASAAAETYVADGSLGSGRSTVKIGSYYYVFYILPSLNYLAYAYSQDPAQGWGYGIAVSEAVSDYTFYSDSSTIVIAYTTGSGTSMAVKSVVCTVGAPLSCGTPSGITSNRQYVGSLSLTKHPTSGRWWLAFRYYSGTTYLVRIYHSTSPPSFNIAYEDIMNGATHYAPAVSIVALPDTSDQALAVAGKYEDGNYWYCRGSTSGFCAQTWTAFGSKTANSYPPKLVSELSGSYAYVLASGRLYRFTGTTLDDLGAFGGTSYPAMSLGSPTIAYWYDQSYVKRQAYGGSSVNYMYVSGLSGLSSPPSYSGTSFIVYSTQLPSRVYFKPENEAYIKQLSETMTASEVFRKVYTILLTQPVAVYDQVVASRFFTAVITEALGVADSISKSVNRLVELVDNMISGELLGVGSSFNLLLAEVLSALDVVSVTQYVPPGEGGGGGGGGGGFIPPPVPPEEPPLEIPTAQVAYGSFAAAAILFGVLAIAALRGGMKPAAAWRRQMRRRRWRKSPWRRVNPFK
ncbi:MAG: hypothetical protein QXY50_02890 [Candidatus Caldarchaeum sp.]